MVTASRTAFILLLIQQDPWHIFHCHLWLKHGPAPIYIFFASGKKMSYHRESPAPCRVCPRRAHPRRPLLATGTVRPEQRFSSLRRVCLRRAAGCFASPGSAEPDTPAGTHRPPLERCKAGHRAQPSACTKVFILEIPKRHADCSYRQGNIHHQKPQASALTLGVLTPCWG